jgi:hypothetical protein
VIGDGSRVEPAELVRRTGWELKPEGLCKGDVCVPLETDVLEVDMLAERLGAPLLRDETHGVWCLGPAAPTGRALTTAQAPDLELPTIDGESFALRSLRGQKVFLLAWASW